MKIFALSLAAATLLAASAADAVTTFTFAGYGAARNAGDAMVTDFSGGAKTALSGYKLSGDAAFLTGTSSVGAAPAMGFNHHDAGQYLSVEKGELETLSTPLIKEISLYVGSLDDYNYLTFHFQDGQTQTFTGTQLEARYATVANGDQQSRLTNGRLTFNFDNAITSVGIGSDSYSFEVADIAARPLLNQPKVGLPLGVPEPATWALMIGGFGLAGVALRRRQASERQAPAL